MRWFAWCLMLSTAALLGCAEPKGETTSTVTPVTEHGDHDHAEAGHDHEGEHAHDDHEHGDHEHAEHDHAEHEGAEHGEAAHAEEDDSAAKTAGDAVRFVADTRIEVPGMMCPFSCWPKVKETLASQPGVEGVQLAEQPADTPEGTIKNRVVELKLNDAFDAQAALAALSEISFEGEMLN